MGRPDITTPVLAVGDRVGRLSIIGPPIVKPEASGQRRSYHPCRCDCGAEKWIKSASLKEGVPMSCGCWRRE
jgi:hypothetical protein